MNERTATTPKTTGRRCNLRIGAAVFAALLVLAVVIVLSIRSRGRCHTDHGGGLRPAGPRRAREFGHRRIFSVGAFDEHAVVDVPVDSESARYRSYVYRGGDWEDFSSGSSQFRRFSPTQLSGAVVAAAVADVRGRVEAPTNVDVVVQAPATDGGCVRASASYAFDESVVVKYRCDGTVVDAR